MKLRISKKNFKEKFNIGLILFLILGLFLFIGYQNNSIFTNNKKNFDINSKLSLQGINVILYKSPDCSCCEGYIKELRAYGENIKVINSDLKLKQIKNQLNIPLSLRSCHTAIYKKSGYYVEGHVPLIAVEKMLIDKPQIQGITLPGMPKGSIGMPGQKQGKFIIYALDNENSKIFMKV